MDEDLGSNHADDMGPRHVDPSTDMDSQSIATASESALLSPTVSESVLSTTDVWPQTGGDGTQPSHAGPLPEGLVAGLNDPTKVKKRSRKPAPLGKRA